MSDQTPPPSQEPDSAPTPEPVVYTPPAEQPVAYTPAPPVSAPVTGASNGMGTAALIFGILGVVQCIPFIGGILAIVFGRMGINKAKKGEATNGGMAKVGFWLGIAGIVISVIGTVVVILVAVFAINVLNTNTSPDINSKTGLADGQYQINSPTASYSLNDRCGFTGDPIDASGATVATGVTVSGGGIEQCSSRPSDVSAIRFDVTGGVAQIVGVQ